MNAEKNSVKIGIVGFSGKPFDQSKARKLLQDIFESLQDQFENDHIEIVSGYTNIGIPRIAYILADEFGFETVGFSAKEALNVDCGLYPVKKVCIIGEHFGDESKAFIAYIDRLIRIGGGNQSLKEVEFFKQKHKNKDLSDLLMEVDLS